MYPMLYYDPDLPEEQAAYAEQVKAEAFEDLTAVPSLRRAYRRDKLIQARRHPTTSDDMSDDYDKHGGKHGRER